VCLVQTTLLKRRQTCSAQVWLQTENPTHILKHLLV
jgi:hypothetical protein